MIRRWIDKIPFVRNHFLTTMFVLGFVLDSITLNRVDETFDNAILAFYVLLAMLVILLHYAAIAERLPERLNRFAKTWAPAVMQYSFGGLLSGMLIFYGRSSAFMESWPFILMIILAIYGNETIKNREQRLVYNLAIFFIGLFSYVVLMVPVWTGVMGTAVFLISGGFALFIMYCFFKLLSKVIPNFITMQRRVVVFVIGLIYVSFNVFYFANIIPPIPLSLKDLGIYHGVVRFGDGTYELKYEEQPWWSFFRQSDNVFHFTPGDSAYCYASVFAPTKLAINIYHRWEYYDESTASWTEHGRFPYSIKGGRDDGYRGYSMISSLREGTWRCSVETERGQVLGREVFTAVVGEKGVLINRID